MLKVLLLVIIAIILIFLILYKKPQPQVPPSSLNSEEADKQLNFNRMAVVGYSIGAQMVSRFFESFHNLKLKDGSPFPIPLAGIMISGGSMSCYTGDANTCPENTSETSYDMGIIPWSKHPPVLLIQSINDNFAPHGKDGASQRYFEQLNKNNAPVALVTTGGDRHGLCPCGVDPSVNFIKKILLQKENFEQSNNLAWNNYCKPFENSNYENCNEDNVNDCNSAGCCWNDKRSHSEYKCFRPKKLDKNNLSWNGSKNPDFVYLQNLFGYMKGTPSTNKELPLNTNCSYGSLVNFTDNHFYETTGNCGKYSDCTTIISKTFPLSKNELLQASVPDRLISSDTLCTSIVKVGQNNVCPDYVQYWLKVIDNNADWSFYNDTNTYNNSRQTAIALPRCKKMPKDGWPYVLYLDFMLANGKSDGWGDNDTTGGMLSINPSITTKNELGLLELATLFNTLLIEGIAIVFTSELFSDSYFYAGGK